MKSGLNGTDYLPSTLCTYRKNFRENFKRQASLFFFGVVSKVVLSCFASLLSIKSLTHPANYRDRNLNFGYRRNTKQAATMVKTAIRCKLPACPPRRMQQGHLGKKSFFSAFSKTFTLSFLVKSSTSDASKCCSKKHNDGS